MNRSLKSNSKLFGFSKISGAFKFWVIGFLCLVNSHPLFAGDVGTNKELVIPVIDVIGGTDKGNNFKNNQNGGYFSTFDDLSGWPFSEAHANQLGNSAMVNDGTNYWDHWIWLGTGKPGGLAISGIPEPEDGAGSVCWWPAPTEWVSYNFNVLDEGNYEILYRIATQWGPTAFVHFHMTVDDVSSGDVEMKPDNMDYWTPQSSPYQRPANGAWAHDYVPGTVPKKWTLKPGSHILKVFIDKYPDNNTGHGPIWVHFFKISSTKSSAIRKLGNQMDYKFEGFKNYDLSGRLQSHFSTIQFKR